MLDYLELAIAWILFLSILPIAGGMFFRAWKIAVRRELRYVAPWYGSTVPQPQRWAHWFAGMNMLGGSVLFAVFLAILLFGVPFSSWAGAVALTIWIYYVCTQLMARKARGYAAAEAEQSDKPAKNRN